ncbi:hypothetical protein [uncultured Desulfobacter sp.]|uniref:hypothetical protein n=1 Tax=uncultured Desulfobacter sp. TaxID=240139 RepID=UPI0029F57820|nr:hypothetical protein [uncultured Desulfobacter sp.]
MNLLQLFPPKQKGSLIKNQFTIPPSMGRGGIKSIFLNSGMRLVISDYKFHEPTILEYINPSEYLGFGFCLSGEIETSSSCLKDSFSIKAGQSGCGSFPESAGFTEKIRPERVIRIAVLMKPDLLPSFVMTDPDRIPAALTGESKAPWRFSDTITPAMRTVINQILCCPYHGLTRRLFIEAKAMELTACKMAQLDNVNLPSPPQNRLDRPGYRKCSPRGPVINP